MFSRVGCSGRSSSAFKYSQKAPDGPDHSRHLPTKCKNLGIFLEWEENKGARPEDARSRRQELISVCVFWRSAAVPGPTSPGKFHPGGNTRCAHHPSGMLPNSGEPGCPGDAEPGGSKVALVEIRPSRRLPPSSRSAGRTGLPSPAVPPGGPDPAAGPGAAEAPRCTPGTLPGPSGAPRGAKTPPPGCSAGGGRAALQSAPRNPRFHPKLVAVLHARAGAAPRGRRGWDSSSGRGDAGARGARPGLAPGESAMQGAGGRQARPGRRNAGG